MINTKTITCETAQIQDDNPYRKIVLNIMSFKEKDDIPRNEKLVLYLVTMLGACTT